MKHSDKVHVTEGSDISFECSMQVNQKLSAVMNFVYSTSNDDLSTLTTYNKTILCPNDSVSEVNEDSSKWIATRQGNTCILTITNVSQEDHGQYGCHVFLPSSNSPYSSDWSQGIFLFTNDNISINNTLGIIVTAFIGILITVIIIIVLVFVVISAGSTVHHFWRNNNEGISC